MDTLLTLDVLKNTFDDIPVGIGIFHVEDLNDIESVRYVFMNKVILYEMRKKKEEVFGKKIIEVAPEAYEHEGGRLVIETYRKIAKEGGSLNLGLVEYSNHMTEGTYECSVHHLQDNYVYVMLRNVTELEQAKNNLEIKNEELSQFAYIVSHDLKEPANTIYSFIQLILDSYSEKIGENVTELLQDISSSTDRMRSLINNLLEFSTVGQKKEVEHIDCNKLLEVIQKDLSAKITDSKASIEVAQLPEICAYRTELRMLFQNLISNALKFTKPGIHPEIKIDAQKKEHWVFSIQDNGIGISEQHKSKVFNVFERIETGYHIDGTGIGLAHCKKIIDLHNGKIWIDSEPGKGSTFYFSIPFNIE